MRDYDEGDLAAAICLSLTERVGIVVFRSLMRHFGSGKAILGATERQLTQVRGIGGLTARKIVERRRRIDWRQERDRAGDLGVAIVPFWAETYPALLKRIFDPPLVLYVKGSLDRYDALAVALVGSRRTSFYGRRQAHRLAGDLARRQATVVSGLARGIDAAAHSGALEAGGRTVAVVGTGLDRVYPPEHEELAARIASNGAVVSELPMDTGPAAWNFPRRNRIISGMSLGVVVVEAGLKSGALITARFAIEHNREVFAVPGKIDSPLTRGVHGLIRDGAKLVQGIDDIIEELPPLQLTGPAAPSPGAAAPENLSEPEQAVYQLLGSDPISIEAIADRSGLDIRTISSALTVLELDRRVKQLPGKEYARL